METFTLAPVGCWIVRAFGRNPLVRTSDRIEALPLILAVTVALAAAPIAGRLGSAQSRKRRAGNESAHGHGDRGRGQRHYRPAVHDHRAHRFFRMG
jgi:hypothetical protein